MSAEIRSAIYAVVSSLFSEPATPKFQLLMNPEIRREFSGLCRALDPSLGAKADQIAEALSRDSGGIAEEYTQVFGHTLSRETNLYELEHMKSKEIFHLTQSLADIQGFYRAFGMEIGPGERADHLAVEAEFLSLVLWKQAAAEKENRREQAEVCAEAECSFARDHLQEWIPGLVRSIQSDPSARFYRLAAEFLSQFVM